MRHYIIKKLFPILPFLFILFFASCKKDSTAPIPEGQVQLAMLDSVNNLRAAGCKCGSFVMPPVKPLIWNNSLAKSAEGHAKDMSNRQYFAHISPEGTSPIQRAFNAGYTGNTIEENIAKGYSNIGSVMAGWKASEDHCKAMMDPMSIEMGAYAYNSYWVQEFGH